MTERSIGHNPNRLRSAGRVVALAGTLAVAGLALEAKPEFASTVRSYHCITGIDQWKPINKGEITVIRASGVVVSQDGSVNGVRQYDSLAETATVVGLKSSNNTDKNWVIGGDNQGSAFILRCRAGFARTQAALGNIVSIVDVRLGLNNPKKSVQAQWIRK